MLKLFQYKSIIDRTPEPKMRIISFLTDWLVVDRIIKHFQLLFTAEDHPLLKIILLQGYDDRLS